MSAEWPDREKRTGVLIDTESLGPAVQVAQAGWHHKVALDDSSVPSMLKSITCAGFARRGLI
ncbi:MAG: hypothetical protein ISS66_21950 [Desulfobacteraceae bacterium]|nr:hypothetical protein [Desulfobacteraceae bacterium]